VRIVSLADGRSTRRRHDNVHAVRRGGEWSFAQTLRHLALATDAWLGRGDEHHRYAVRDLDAIEAESHE
jgi:hypothetical protein